MDRGSIDDRAAGFQSSAAEILQRSTAMPVVQVTAAVKVEPDRVYVIPPGKHLFMADGTLRLSEIERTRGCRVTVDHFFRTLADTHGPRAAAIVLSGADSDGSIGLKRIKELGGLTVAQDPAQAEHNEMPRAAIATGMVDWVLRVEEMPARLATYRATEAKLKLPRERPVEARERESREAGDETALREVLIFLRMRMGHDFSYYKRATVLRRIARRMQVNGTETLPDYLDFLRTHAGEAGAVTAALAISYDIDDRKRVGQALGASEERLRLIIENAHEYGIFAINLAGRITNWNPGAELVLGFSEKEIMGQSV